MIKQDEIEFWDVNALNSISYKGWVQFTPGVTLSNITLSTNLLLN